MCDVVERRIDPDYVPTDYELENATRLLHAAAQVGLPFQYKNANGNGFQKWVLAVTAGTVVAGIGGGVLMYGKLAALEQQNADESREIADVKHEVADVKADVKRLLTESRPRR